MLDCARHYVAKIKVNGWLIKNRKNKKIDKEHDKKYMFDNDDNKLVTGYKLQFESVSACF